MATQNIQGIDLAVGKVSLPITLASITGPNNFGESLTLQYSTLSLLPQIRTWNEETTTSIVGLGWTLTEQYIMRIGNGSLNDQFLLSGNQALLLIDKTQDSDGVYTLTFGTATHSLSKITYKTKPGASDSPEIWTIIDSSGTTYVYGGVRSAIEWGIRWMPTDGQSPIAWIGTSTSTENQQQYPLIWHLISKENIYGQRVEYDYFSVAQLVGSNVVNSNTEPAAKYYTSACYLQSIRVASGSSLTLSYNEKEIFEYPILRAIINKDGTIINAYQDRHITKYLQSISINSLNGNLQSVIKLTYDFLFSHYSELKQNKAFYGMQKRVLTEIQYLTPDGQNISPPQLIDYWGLKDNIFSTSITDDNLLKLTDQDLWTEFQYINKQKETFKCGALFGHLSSLTSSTGAITLYSYREVSNNYTQINWPEKSDWNAPYAWADNWENQLNFNNIPYPEGGYIDWKNPRPYWGPDNYVVMRWDSQNNNQIAIKIFEWIGRWVEVALTESEVALTESADISVYYFTLNVSEFSDDAVKIATGNGKCVVCILGISGDQQALITILNRDPYLPGQWNITSKLNTSAKNFEIVSVKQTLQNYQQLEIGIGNNIIAILDKYGQELYLYSLYNNTWVSYDDDGIYLTYSNNPFGSLSTGMAVNNDDVFILGSVHGMYVSDAQDTFYWLYHYNTLQSPQGAWQPKYTCTNWPKKLASNGANDGCQGIIFSGMGGGIFSGQAYVTSTNPADYFALIVVSWDDDFNVNLQGINSVDAYGNASWGVTAYQDGFWWVPSVSGAVSSSNLINMVPADNDDGNPRYVTRYAGGNSNDGINNGWIGDKHFDMLPDDTDAWTQLATMDTTIDINGSGDSYNYHFFQYSPYANGGTSDSNHPYWILQPNVSAALGGNKDWLRVIEVINEVTTLVSLSMQFLSLWLSLAPEQLFQAAEAGEQIARYALKVLHKVGATAITAGNLTRRFVKSEAKKALSGRRDYLDQGMKYLLVGPGSIQQDKADLGSTKAPSPYYQYQAAAYTKIWDPELNCWMWRDIPDLQQNADNLAYQNVQNAFSSSILNFKGGVYRSFILSFLAQPTYVYGDSFIPMSYVAYGAYSFTNDLNLQDDDYFRCLYFSQVAFFQNSGLLSVQLLPSWEINNFTVPNAKSTGDSHNYGTVSLPFIMFNYVSDNSQPSPIMYASWGGILAYQPPLTGFYYEGHHTLDWVWEGQGVDDASKFDNPEKYCLPALQYAQYLSLTMALNGSVSGDITDYIVDAIYIDDGYQSYKTYFQYMPWNAYYDTSLNSVIYNQVRITQGSNEYITSAILNGWTEYYFYPGGFNYPSSSVDQQDNNLPTSPSALPYDPAGLYDDFSNVNSNATNVARYYSLMAGQLYCQRTLKSQGNNDFSEGYEVARQQIFLKGYELFLNYDDAGNPTTPQTVTGTLSTIAVNYSAPTNTNYFDISLAYKNGAASLNATYYYYDLNFTDRDGNAVSFYGPWDPSNTNPPYCLWKGDYIRLNTALPLSKLSYNYHQNIIDTANRPTSIEAYYTQYFPGLVAVLLGVHYYQPFINLNLYSPTIQSITWYHPNVPTTSRNGNYLPYAIPETTWGDQNGINWQIINSTVNPWQEFMISEQKSLWYPSANYNWKGNPDGSQQTSAWNGWWTSGCFPWSTPAINDYWSQGSTSTAQISSTGIVLAKTTSTNIPIFNTYDNNLALPIAQFTNTSGNNSENIANSNLAFYSGFEAYENLSLWQLMDGTNNIPMNFSNLSNTGNRSLIFSNNNILQISFPSALTDSRAWVYSCCILSTQTETQTITLTLTDNFNNQLAVYTSSISVSNGWNFVRLIVPTNSISQITSLSLSVNLNSSSSNLYLDNIYFIPVTETSFSAQTYDLSSQLPISSGSLSNPNFSTRTIYNNLKQPIATVTKANQMLINHTLYNSTQAAATITMSHNYFSRNNLNNKNNFSASDPNANFTLVTGINQNLAGLYFDFRDGQRYWTGGTVVANSRSLILKANEQTSYALPTDYDWGIGIRVQLQGFVSIINTAFPSGNYYAAGLPTPSASDPFHVWGMYETQNDPSDKSCVIAYNINFDQDFSGNRLTYSTSSSLCMTIPQIAPNNNALTTNAEDNFFGSFYGIQNNPNDPWYRIISFSADGFWQIYINYSIPVYPPMICSNNLLYFAVEQSNPDYPSNIGALFAMDITDFKIRGPGPFNFIASPLVIYDNILPSSSIPVCPVAPTTDPSKNNIVFILVSSATDSITNSQATAVLVKYKISSNQFITAELSNSTQTLSAYNYSPSLVNDGTCVIFADNTLAVFDVNLKLVNSISITEALAGPPVAGNNRIYLAFSSGLINIYDTSLNLIAQTNTTFTITCAPVIHGDKISVVTQNDNGWAIFTFDNSGLLISPPYEIDNSIAQASVLIQAFTPEQSALCVMCDSKTFLRLNFSVPSTTLSLGNITVSWDVAQKQYSINGPLLNSPSSVNVNNAYGDWLLFILGNICYFYADGQQIFAEELNLSALTGGNFVISANSEALNCRDIIIFNNPSLSVTYSDGAGKTRQTQSTAEILTPD